MVVGNIVHEAIEKFWNDGAERLVYIYKEFLSRLPSDKLSLDYAYKCNTFFTQKFQNLLSSGDVVEEKFRIPLEKDVFIVGKMDRISNGNVFDWKTARRPLTTVSGNIQFILYNWAYKKMYNSNPSGVYYAALGNGSLVKYHPDPVAEKSLFDEIIPQAIRTIKDKDYIRNGIFRKACYRCPYSESCLNGGG